MLELKRLRDDPEAARAALTRRGGGDAVRLDALLEADRSWRAHQAKVEGLRAERNRLSAQVAEAKRRGTEAADAIAGVRRLAADLGLEEAAAQAARAEVDLILPELPNLLDESVPDGGEADAALVRTVGEPVVRPWAKPHWEIGVRLGVVDFARAVKVSGSRFAFLRSGGARLGRALGTFFVDLQVSRGAVELAPPVLVTADTVFGTGQLPKFREDMFATTDGRYLISTAEIPLTAYHRDEILDAEDLPLRYVALSPCFRSEAGAAGKDTRGLIRMHQFDKVEMVRLTRPEDSWAELERMVEDAERALAALELPYRVVTLAAGDTGFGSAKTYDLEVFLPGQGAYREISSCSNYTDFQSRRLAMRFREGRGPARLVHTLNGSQLPIGRTLAALLENGLEEDGRVRLPQALGPYLGGMSHLG